MDVYILLFTDGSDNEGIHSLEIKGETIVLMFEDRDDAERYCGLLEAQDFPRPRIELINKDEVEVFCSQSGYDAKFVEKGFLPQNDLDRLLLSPPERNLDVSLWNEEHTSLTENSSTQIKDPELESFRKSLEELF